ncbi:MAG: MATE family efflux transporter [Erysipelotrichaceae bacterium]|nr:MATE family efflux transporter [Erysipelotrichaceae bacterium]MDY5251594.1 MATE family efflux transporter [Erysipelotrichaceae bacterium]
MNDKIYLFEKEKISKSVMALAVPTILSSLVMVIYNLADTFFVGMLNDPIQNSGVTLAAPVLLAFNAINNLFGVGSSSMMARALGRRDYETVAKTSSIGFYCSLICSAIFSILCFVFMDQLLVLLGADASTSMATYQYLRWTVVWGAIPAILNVVLAYLVRSEGASLHASIGTMSGCILNIILDPIFILPGFLNMKTEGAALATFISNCFACMYFFVLLYKKRGNTFVSLNIKKFSLDKEIIKGICIVGVPASIQNLLNVTGMTIFNNITSTYGATAVASMGIVQKVYNIPWYISSGISQGVMPLISYNYASGNRKRMRDAFVFASKISLSIIICFVLMYYVFADQVIQLFMNNPEIIHHGAILLRGFCLALPFLCIDFMAVGVFQAIGLGKYSLIFAVMRKIILEIPAIIILNLLFPLYGLGYSQFVAELILSIVAVIMLRKIFAGQV